MVASARQKPDRMTFGNLSNGRTLEAFFNPTEFEENVKPEYAKIKTLGNSHEIHQYQGTTSHGFSFDMSFSAFDDQGARLDDVAFARKFLLSLCYSSRSAKTISQGTPPRVLFVWPSVVSISSLIQSVRIKNTDFAKNGRITRFTATVSLDEVRDERLYAEDVLANGTLRSSGGKT